MAKVESKVSTEYTFSDTTIQGLVRIDKDRNVVEFWVADKSETGFPKIELDPLKIPSLIDVLAEMDKVIPNRTKEANHG